MISESTFLKGVSIYLKAHLYGNSRTADLWKGISEASGIDVPKIMANWTLKVGFPVITVEETEEGLKIRQNRFLSGKPNIVISFPIQANVNIPTQARAILLQQKMRHFGISLSN